MLLTAVAVLLVLIAVGVVVIHRLGAQQHERIAVFHYGDALPGIGRRTRRHRRSAADASGSPARPTATATVKDIDVGPTMSGRGRRIMATLGERKTYREKIMRALYEAAEGNRLLGVDGAKLRDHLRIPAQDMAAACTYLEGEGWVVVDWARGNTPAMITLTHQGIRRMETEEEARG